MIFIHVLTGHHREVVESLAAEIWTEHYTPIIGREQVAYMLERFQSKQAISEQISGGTSYYLLKENEEYLGYLAIEPKGDELFLSKIYVKSILRSQGYGRKALQFAEKFACERGLRKIVLTVNKRNAVAIRAYEKIGFRNVASLVQDIGSGFVMDDYKMEKEVAEPPCRF